MRLRALISSALLGLCCLPGCDPHPATADILAIRSEAPVPDSLDRLSIHVSRPGAEDFDREYRLPGEAQLPGTFVLSTPDDRASGDPMTVTIRARKGDDGPWRITRVVRVGFVQHHTKLLRIPLEYACLDVDCSKNPDSTCVGGSCQKPDLDIEQQPDAENPTDPVPTSGGLACFDEPACLASAHPVLPAACSFAAPATPFNVAIEWRESPGKLVTLIPGPAGYTVSAGTVTLSAVLCEALTGKGGKAAAVYVAPGCAPVTPEQSFCAPAPGGGGGAGVSGAAGQPGAGSGGDAGQAGSGGDAGQGGMAGLSGAGGGGGDAGQAGIGGDAGQGGIAGLSGAGGGGGDAGQGGMAGLAGAGGGGGGDAGQGGMAGLSGAGGGGGAGQGGMAGLAGAGGGDAGQGGMAGLAGAGGGGGDAGACAAGMAGSSMQPSLWPDSGTMYCSDGTKPTDCHALMEPASLQDGALQLNVPSYTPIDGGTVIEDHLTGLLWEASPPAPTLSLTQAQQHCQSLALHGVCGWRLPTRREQVSILDLGKDNPSLSADFGADTSTLWSSTPLASDPSQQWFFFSTYGAISPDKTDAMTVHSARCVLGPQIPDTEVVLAASGDHAIDLFTGLDWQVTAQPTGGSWMEALVGCRDLQWAGYHDWRLPSQKELLSIVDDRDLIQALPPSFPSLLNGKLWSSSPTMDGDSSTVDDIWLIFTGNGQSGHEGPALTNPYFCVRGGAIGSRWPDSVTPNCAAMGVIVPCDPHSPTPQDGDLQLAVPTYLPLGNGWVKDLTTGLVWETIPTQTLAQKAVTHCDALGGGWRLPTIKELLSLADYGSAGGALPAPFSPPTLDLISQESDPNIVGRAWVLSLGKPYPGAILNVLDKATVEVLCVQGPEHVPQLSLQQGNIIVDNSTGLQWMATDSMPKSWDKALGVCANLGSGWRLPTIKELASIASPGSLSPTDPMFGLSASPYWSATPAAFDPTVSWALDATDGTLKTFPFNESGTPPLARCVRGP